MPLPENYFYANGVDPSGGTLPFALVGGEQLGLDNNYKYAVFNSGRIEHAYLAPVGSPGGVKAGFGDAGPDTYYSESQLRAAGVSIAGAPTDSHGVPQPAGYPAANNPKGGGNALNDFLGALSFTVLTFGFGSAVAAPAAAGEIGAGASAAADVSAGAVSTGGVTTGYEGLATSGLEISTGGVATESYLAPYAAAGVSASDALGALKAAAAVPAVLHQVKSVLGGSPAPASPQYTTAAPALLQGGATAPSSGAPLTSSLSPGLQAAAVFVVVALVLGLAARAYLRKG